MSTLKLALKAAKAALDDHRFEDAAAEAEKVLALDPRNYHGNVFLGLALDKLDRQDDAIKAYQKALSVKDRDPLAWQGLIAVYDRQGQQQVNAYQEAAVRLAEIYMEAGDQYKCQAVFDKFQVHARDHGTRSQQRKALEMLLPSSPIYAFLEGRLPHPSHTYVKIAQIVEAEEREKINKEIGERRTRLGSKLDQVNIEVRRDVLQDSPLPEIYQCIIDWTNDDDERRLYEEKLLQHTYDTLVVLPADQKGPCRAKVEDMSKGLVILRHPFRLAWHVVLEWKDGESLSAWDPGVFKDFIEIFPEDGLAKVLKAYLTSQISPIPIERGKASMLIEGNVSGKAPEGDVLDELSSEERLVLMTDGIADSSQSILSHRLLLDYYEHLEEHEAAVDLSRKGHAVIIAEVERTGLDFTNIDAINLVLATSFIYYQAPKNFPEAKKLFDSILRRKPTSARALIGSALILREQGDYSLASDFLKRAILENPDDVTIKAEAAWCEALQGHYDTSVVELKACASLIEARDPRSRNTKAEILHRIGMCLWLADESYTARKDRKRSYSYFLASLQCNINYATAYTSLGLFYADYAKDEKRARKCFLKAFELSPSEITAAERLARAFADEGDWDLVQLVAQRVVDSGKTRTVAGSKQKGVSWPLAALGVVELNKRNYTNSISFFQSALRISPADYHSWIGLGESYHNSGRYIAATRALQQAEQVQNKDSSENWFAEYMLANVKRELGEYEESIQGYEDILLSRNLEYGVLIALAQTLVEAAWHNIELGFFGRAIANAKRVIDVAQDVAKIRSNAFNLWKTVGDGCIIFAIVQSHIAEFPWMQMKELLASSVGCTSMPVLCTQDEVDEGSNGMEQEEENGNNSATINLRRCIHSAILAQKRALSVAADDKHAQAVAWYNLGWTEHRAHMCLTANLQAQPSARSSKYLRASIHCFKRAIEIEAGNSKFWNALGVATSRISPKISQHSFVRSLVLNDKHVGVWTNLGALCLLNHDYQLANIVFSRAQSTDPEYSQAWLGQGLLALLLGDRKEAQLLFAQAFEISDASILPARRFYTLSVFDRLVSGDTELSIADLIQPIFALHQLELQMSLDSALQHLSALYSERIGEYSSATDSLTAVCDTAEQEYEASESLMVLTQFAEGKADLARVCLAKGDFAAAADSAETALQLSTEDTADGPSIPEPGARQKCRLSAQITASLAFYHMKTLDKALDMLRAALDESKQAANVVCLLVQVLWARGGMEEHSVAIEQLLSCVEKSSTHLTSLILLAVIATLEDDEDTLAEVSWSLQALRTSGKLDNSEQRRLDQVFLSIAAASRSEEEAAAKEVAAAQTAIYLSPHRPHGWTSLASLCDDPFPAGMALKTAQREVPPNGLLEVEALAEIFVGTGKALDMQRAIMVAPWMRPGWQGFDEILSA